MNINQSKSRHRSPNFPAIDLKEAVERVKLLYQADKMAGCPIDAVHKQMGFNRTTGASQGALAALRKFALIKEENKRIFVTERAKFILILDESDEKREKLVKESALKPAIYRTLWTDYNAHLPSEITLRSDLLTKYKFNEKSVLKFIADFKNTLDYAGIKVGENLEFLEDEISEEKTVKNEKPNISKPIYKSSMENAEVNEYKIPRKENRLALLKLESPVTKKDIESISKWLELLQDTIADEQSENTKEE